MNSFITLIISILIIINSIKITSTKKSSLIERLGKYNRQLQPGISLLIPIIERVVSTESLKERVLDIPSQQCITKDNVSIEVDAVVYWLLVDHEKGFYAVQNLTSAMTNLVLTQIRAEMGKLDLDETFTTRSEVNEILLRELDEATNPWGVKVMRVEMRDIVPAPRIKEAMDAQMTAEREKRAKILKSEGEKEALLNEARAKAESLVLDAQAKKEAIILNADAEAEKQQKIAEAEAYSALQIAKAIDENKYTEEVLRFFLAKDWMEMGEHMAQAKAGSVLMVDPKSPASLLAALKNFQLNES
tara:strand:- start:576 stop:1481 length:906 start_codon:yes stop_codon:yes gene_type:complete